MEKNNKIEIRISGMSCTGCENRVENVLKNIENVESVNANYNTGIVEIETNDIKNLNIFRYHLNMHYNSYLQLIILWFSL